MRSPAEFKRDVATKLLTRSLERLREITPSRRLRSSLIRLPGTLFAGPGQPVQAILQYPEYWALWLHDGHGPINAGFGKRLVFFNDPNDDPRIRPIPEGYPTRASSARRLSPSEFEFGLQQNRLRAAQGLDPYMWVLPRVGPFVGYHWLEDGGPFNEGMRGFLARQQGELERDFSRWMNESVIVNDRATARVRLT